MNKSFRNKAYTNRKIRRAIKINSLHKAIEKSMRESKERGFWIYG